MNDLKDVPDLGSDSNDIPTKNISDENSHHRIAPNSLENVIRRTASQPLRFKFSVFYIGITGIVAYLNGLAGCSKNLLVDQVSGVGLLLLALLGLEWFEQNRFCHAPPRKIALAFLITRMLIEGIVSLDCNNTALFLYPLIPYSAHFDFGSPTSTALSLAYVLLTFWRVVHTSSGWYQDTTLVSNLLAFSFVMLFVPLIAHIIRRDDEHRSETEKLLSDLEVSHLKLQAYTEQVADLAAAEERNRLARDIHDSLGHYLTAVNIQLEKAMLYQSRNPEEALKAIRDAKQAATDALRDVRRSVSALRSTEIQFSLHDALEKLVQGINGSHISVQFNILGDESQYSRSALMTLYRAAQEGLTNIQKHARATYAELKVEFGEKEACLTISDNGQGFDPEMLEQHSPSQAQPGFGLRGIRERIEIARGRLALSSNPQQGTQLTVTVPKIP
jgi:signal transduction histidine kinase